MEGATFKGADLSQANLRDATGAEYAGSTGVPKELPVPDPACEPGSGQQYAGWDLTRVKDFPDDLSCADLTGAKLDGVDLSSVRLDRAILRKASLTGAKVHFSQGSRPQGGPSRHHSAASSWRART